MTYGKSCTSKLSERLRVWRLLLLEGQSATLCGFEDATDLAVGESSKEGPLSTLEVAWYIEQSYTDMKPTELVE